MHGVLVAKPILAPTPQQLTSQLHSMHSNMARRCAATETRCNTGVLDIDAFTLRHANTSPRNTAIILVCNRTIQPPPFHSSSHPVEDSLITTSYLPHFAPYHSYSSPLYVNSLSFSLQPNQLHTTSVRILITLLSRNSILPNSENLRKPNNSSLLHTRHTLS